MSKYSIKKYTPELFDKWNDFVETSNNGTLFHRLDFLDYHKNKFAENEHHLVWLKGEAIFAVMPMAIFQENGKKIARSPYGASFGGIVYASQLNLKNALIINDLLIDHLKQEEISEFYIGNVPINYFKNYTNYLDFSLLHNGAILNSKDVFNVIELKPDMDETIAGFEGRARTTIKKHLNDFNIIADADISDFYPILLEDKKRHNNSKPTHSLEDLRFLKNKFPDRVIVDIAVHKQNQSRAGICYFITKRENTIMTFYMSQEDQAKGLNGTNILLYHGIKRAVDNGFKFFDFGGSTIGYTVQNIGVSMFKESFGANGYSRDQYKLGF